MQKIIFNYNIIFEDNYFEIEFVKGFKNIVDNILLDKFSLNVWKYLIKGETIEQSDDSKSLTI